MNVEQFYYPEKKWILISFQEILVGKSVHLLCIFLDKCNWICASQNEVHKSRILKSNFSDFTFSPIDFFACTSHTWGPFRNRKRRKNSMWVKMAQFVLATIAWKNNITRCMSASHLYQFQIRVFFFFSSPSTVSMKGKRVSCEIFHHSPSVGEGEIACRDGTRKDYQTKWMDAKEE